MGLADVGDDAVVGFADLHELGNVVRVACAHFDNGNLSVRRDFQQRKRDAYVIVQITFRGDGPETSREDSPEQFLSGGLAVRPGYSYDCQMVAFAENIFAMIAGKCLQLCQCVVRLDDAAASVF